MFAAERMKLRRSMVWWVVVLLPLLAVASGGANYWLQTTNGALETGWDVLTGQITLFYGMMFFSTGVALLGAAVWRPEHRSSSWNRVLTTGRSPVSLVLMKSVVILLLVVLVQLVFVGLSWGIGLLLGLRGAPTSSFLVAAALGVAALVDVDAGEVLRRPRGHLPGRMHDRFRQCRLGNRDGTAGPPDPAGRHHPDRAPGIRRRIDKRRAGHGRSASAGLLGGRSGGRHGHRDGSGGAAPARGLAVGGLSPVIQCRCGATPHSGVRQRPSRPEREAAPAAGSGVRWDRRR